MPRSSAPNSVITENTNIDNIKIPGSYTSQGANIAGERRWGNFTVFNDGNYYIVQEFTNNDETKFNRVYSGDGNGWGDWFEFATKGDFIYESGNLNGFTIPANSFKTSDQIRYSKTFAQPPVVAISLIDTVAVVIPHIVYAGNQTMYIRVYNPTNTEHTVNLRWNAFGINF